MKTHQEVTSVGTISSRTKAFIPAAAKPTMNLRFILISFAAIVIATRAHGQNYSVDWATLHSGGGSSVEGVYEASGTIGQFGVGGSVTTCPYSLLSGFWAIASPATTTNTSIRGTLRFSNANPDIVELLSAPGNEGMKSYFLTAASRPPAAPINATTPELAADSRTGTPYEITVAGSDAGIAYAVSPRVILLNGLQSYYFNARTSAVVKVSAPTVDLDFEECVGVVTVRFVNSVGAPSPVDGGQILVSNGATRRSSIPGGSTQARMYLRGGATHALAITVTRGTDFYRDRLTFALNTNVLAVCDGFSTVDMLIPEPGALGRIEGRVDMVGEFELTVDGSDAANLPDSTGIIALNGPFQNQRWTAVPGNHFTIPSSGKYVLSDLAPSTLSPTSQGYTVYSQMYFRTNREIESFRSPALGAGSNAPVVIAPGQTVNLSNLFVIRPGYLQGKIFLQGPPEKPDRESLFRGIDHASDYDPNHDGVPDLLGGFGVYASSVRAEGVNRLAPGATLTAAYGFAISDFDGELLPNAGSFEGSYEFALGGLNSQPSLWSPKYLNLLLSHPAGLAASDYYKNSLAIIDRRNPQVEILPGRSVAHDIAYCFSEVRLVIRSTSGKFHSPEVNASSGSFSGRDFQQQPADYSVSLTTAAGTPNHAADAANEGEVVMYLPQGRYRLSPSVIYSASNQGRTGLQPIDVTVGCQERIVIGDALHQIKSTLTPDGKVGIEFRSEAGQSYQLERATRLNPPNWQAWGPPIPGTGNPISVLDTAAAGDPQAYYRIRFNP